MAGPNGLSQILSRTQIEASIRGPENLIFPIPQSMSSPKYLMTF